MGQNNSRQVVELHQMTQRQILRKLGGMSPYGRTITESIRKGFSPTNSFIITINIILFALIIIFWFWFIGSQQLYMVLDDKAKEINNLTKDDLVLNESINTFLNNIKNDSDKIEKVKQSIENRNKINVKKFREYFLLPLFIFLTMAIVYTVYIVKFREGFKLREFVLITIMILMFSTEIIFFFVVITDFKYIPTSTVILNLLEKNVL